MMKLIKFFIFSIVLTACNIRNERVEYFDSGKVKSIEEVRDGVLDGTFKDYLEDGTLYRSGLAENGIIREITYYYKSGRIKESEKFDVSGKIIDAEIFLENGLRDSVAHPFVDMPEGDTISHGDEGYLEVTMLNSISSLYDSGKLYITNRLDTLNGHLSLADTIAVVALVNKKFRYNFSPEKLGRDTIFGQLRFQRDRGQFIDILTEEIYQPYYVK